jgi:hypothetical protein
MIYATGGMGATCAGPAGVLIPLGIEYLVSNPILVTQLYNYFSLFTITIVAVMTSQRDEKFIAILLPLWAGFCMFAGWLKYPDQATGFGILVVLTAIGIINYMQVTRHERFGIAGPGSTVVKLFTFLILLQCIIGFVNMNNIFPSEFGNVAPTNNQYTNIDLNENMQTLNAQGGMDLGIVDAAILFNIGVAALKVIVTMLLSIALFAVVVASAFPWIVQAGNIGISFLVVMQCAIWTMYAWFVFNLYFKPTPDPGW